MLATLGGGRKARLKDLLARICALQPEKLNRALVQVSAVTGLRGTTERFGMEMSRMGLSVEFRKNILLREAAEDVSRALATDVMEGKFGKLPGWAVSKLETSTYDDVRHMLKNIHTAPTLESLFGKKRAAR